MNAPTDNNTQDWYVMCHLNPMQIETLLKKDSKGEFRQDGPADTPYSFYIPYLHMPTAETLEAQEESDKGRKAYDSIRRNKELGATSSASSSSRPPKSASGASSPPHGTQAPASASTTTATTRGRRSPSGTATCAGS